VVIVLVPKPFDVVFDVGVVVPAVVFPFVDYYSVQGVWEFFEDGIRIT
jgi:hypothetical protein